MHVCAHILHLSVPTACLPGGLGKHLFRQHMEPDAGAGMWPGPHWMQRGHSSSLPSGCCIAKIAPMRDSQCLTVTLPWTLLRVHCKGSSGLHYPSWFFQRPQASPWGFWKLPVVIWPIDVLLGFCSSCFQFWSLSLLGGHDPPPTSSSPLVTTHPLPLLSCAETKRFSVDPKFIEGISPSETTDLERANWANAQGCTDVCQNTFREISVCGNTNTINRKLTGHWLKQHIPPFQWFFCLLFFSSPASSSFSPRTTPLLLFLMTKNMSLELLENTQKEKKIIFQARDNQS